MSVLGARDAITEAVLSWDGMIAAPHRFGGTEFRLGSREIGHIHGDRLVDIPFPSKVRDQVVAAGDAQPHHLLPETGWISVIIHGSGDVKQAIALLRRSYEIARQQKARRRISSP